jgi:hypothetical protein
VPGFKHEVTSRRELRLFTLDWSGLWVRKLFNCLGSAELFGVMHTTMFLRRQEEGLQIFVKGWELYRQIISHNYMNHAEVIAAVRSVTGQRDSASLRILEVGCGDSHAVSQAFADCKNVCYTGVDMSDYALDYARRNLEGLNWTLDLIGRPSCWSVSASYWPRMDD